MTNTTSPNEPVAPDEPAQPETPAADPLQPSKEKRKAGLASWAFVLGIIGILFALIPPTSKFGLFLGVVALVLGGLALRRKKEHALRGVIVGALALILGAIFVNVYGGGSSTSAEEASSDTAATSSAATPAAAASAPVAQESAPAAPKPAPAAPKPAPAKPAPAKPAAPSGTPAQMQALSAAKSYLASGMGFSQGSLLEQLTSSYGNGFEPADAQWAVAQSGADWNEQALSAAKGYLASGMGFSEASLTGQLTSSAGNKFTDAQAGYAVAHAGADWNAQAALAAKGYMDSGIGFSRQSLIEQLTSSAGNKFTEAQAEFGADKVGLK